MIRGQRGSIASLVFAWGLSLPGLSDAAPISLIASGFVPGDIQVQVDAFRSAVGEPNHGNAPGSPTGGRREINWDGGGSLATSQAPTPFTGFQDTRGAAFTTPGLGFVQATSDGLATQFANPSYATIFAPFSAARLFTPIESNVTDVTFFVPGTSGAVPATVSAFGAVFSDVDSSTSTSLQFFTTGGATLGTFDVPALAGEQTLSFLGVLFDAGEQIGRIRITTGNVALGPNDVPGATDVVAMDDFLYSEPVAVPEPGPAALLAVGLAAAMTHARPRAGG